MAEEKVYQGVRAEDTWLAKGPITMPEAEELILKHLRGANLDKTYYLEEEGDHLMMTYSDSDQPVSGGYPGNNDFAKNDTWGSVGKARSDKRKEFPNP
jgi:hypothetical protein